MNAVPKTIEEFAEACRDLECDEIGKLFEDTITHNLRRLIYTTFWSKSPEPCRAAMHQIGARYCVSSLIDY